MATVLNSFQFNLNLSWDYANVLDFGSAKDTIGYQLSKSLTDGSAKDQAEVIFHDIRSLEQTGTAAAIDDIDLSGSLVDAFGNTIAFTEIVGLMVYNPHEDTDSILAIGGGSNTFDDWLGATGDQVKLGPGGLLFLFNPSAGTYTVSAGTADILRITNLADNDLQYKIVILGRDT